MVFTDNETDKDSDALDRPRNCDRTLLEALFVPVARLSWWLPEPLATTLPLADDASGMNVAVSIWSDITGDGDQRRCPQASA